MTQQIETATLREWLDAQRPVTVLDIRTDEDRARWAFPGSVHVNAYEALRDGRPGALTDAAFPADRPVVTVCNADRVSQTAAKILAGRGFDARSLAGGMKAWSLVLPAHASEPIPFDGLPLAAPLRDVSARLSDWIASESAFVERVTSKLPPTPPNFARIVELNETGEIPSGDPTELEAGANRCAVR